MFSSQINKIPKNFIYAFFCAMIGGYVFHLYAFTNLIPNADGIGRVYDLQEMTVSGRWFLHYATMPNGFLQMPSFIGLLTLLFLALSAGFIIDLLEIKNKFWAGFLGFLFITFPSVGFTFLYLFTASAYSIGIFLAILSLWCHEKGGYFRILGVIALAFSMGVYQAYAPFAIGLSVVLVLKKILLPTETVKSITIYGLGKIAYLSASAMLYYLILHLALLCTGQELLPYLGMENTSYPFASLPSLILNTYKQVIVFFFLPQQYLTTNFAICAHIIFFVLGLITLFYLLKPYLKAEKWRVLGFLCLCAIMPLAIGFVQIISPWSAPTPLMQYPYVIAYILVIFFLDQGENLLPSPWKLYFPQISAVIMVFLAFSGAWLCNVLYTASAQAHQATESYVTRLMTRVESTEGYQWDMPVLIIGAFPDSRYYADIDAYAFIDHYSAPQNSVLPLNKHIYYYCNDWLNIPISEPNEEDMIEAAQTELFRSMPTYPDDGSIRLVDGQIIVKIGEEYLPKSDYELAYEASQGK